MKGDERELWTTLRNFYKPLLSGHPLLLGHLGKSRKCELNRGFTVVVHNPV